MVKKGTRIAKHDFGKVLSKSEWNCAQKKPYESKRIAETRAGQIGDKRDEVLFTYRCRHCKKWHLTRKLQHGDSTVPGTAPTLDGFKKVVG